MLADSQVRRLLRLHAARLRVAKRARMPVDDGLDGIELVEPRRRIDLRRELRDALRDVPRVIPCHHQRAEGDDRGDDQHDVRRRMRILAPVREAGHGEHGDDGGSDREKEPLAGLHAGFAELGTATTSTSRPSPFSMIRSITDPWRRRYHHDRCVWPRTTREIPFSRAKRMISRATSSPSSFVTSAPRLCASWMLSTSLRCTALSIRSACSWRVCTYTQYQSLLRRPAIRLARLRRAAVRVGSLDIATSMRSTVFTGARPSSRRTIPSRARSTVLATSRNASSRSVVRFSSVKKFASAAATLSAG